MCSERNRKLWTAQEESLLRNLYESLGPKNWKKISKEFKKEGFRRKEIEIRQKWINHMDPEISNEGWNHDELQTLYHAYDNVGSKWCLIRNSIPGRTQIKIKNKFYSNIRVYIRFVMLYIEGKNCKNKTLINRIAPNALNQIYHGEKRFQHFGSQFKQVLAQMGYEIDKAILERRIESRWDLYEDFNEKINLILRQITTTEEFKNILENDESYYSEISSGKENIPIFTRSKIVTIPALKSVLSGPNSSVSIIEESHGSYKNVTSQGNGKPFEWSTMIVIQPRRISLQPVFYYPVYFPWGIVKPQ